MTAAANTDPESIERAHALGYEGDTWRMSVHHEIAHTWLAITFGAPVSPTLWKLAHPAAEVQLHDDAVAYEEAAVLTWQAGLDKSEPEPWSMFVMHQDLPTPS